jgi:hypothetical protein
MSAATAQQTACGDRNAGVPAHVTSSQYRREWRRSAIVGFLFALGVVLCPSRAHAWGDEGHEIIGLVAEHDLDPAVRAEVLAMLATDPLSITTGKDMASEATWADKYRDSDRPNGPRYRTTHNWHFVDIEIDGPDIDAACFAHPALPPGTLASAGPENDCVIDKIDEFLVELKSPDTDADERRMALQFLLHFVGDIHQPLHASDNHDKGGNDEVIATHPLPGGNLHHYWDTEFVEQLGTDPNAVANTLLSQITDAQRATWSQGTPTDWAQESFAVAQQRVFGELPAPTSVHHYKLAQPYIDDATAAVSLQLQRAGVRLGWLLNTALGAVSLPQCTAAIRAGAIPDLTSISGTTVSSVTDTSDTATTNRAFFVTSSLPFDGNDANGLQAAFEARLTQGGWSRTEAESGAQLYASRWTVRVAGCGQLVGTMVIGASDTANSYRGRIDLIAFP